MEALVSIIVPIYNKEKYLKECLKSIEKQSYSNIEILLIDDGSTDSSLLICEEHKKADQRIKIITKANGGVSETRNYGLCKANGEYIAFVDPDDYIDIRYIERLVLAIKNNDADISYCFSYDIFENSGQITSKSKNNGRDIVINPRKYNWIARTAHPVIWGTLIKFDIASKTKFDESIFIAEDSLYFANCLLKANKIVCVDLPLYFYRINEYSLTSGGYNEKKATEIEAWKQICMIYKKNGWNLVYISSRAALASRCICVSRKYCADKDFIKNDYYKLKKLYKKNIFFYLFEIIRCMAFGEGIKAIYKLFLWDKWIRKVRKECL